MEYLNLEKSDLYVSRICMGGCPMGGHGWGKVSDKDLVDSVHMALDVGINFFDTSDVYGLGKAEELLGEALKEKKSNVIIASKFGVRVENGKTIYDNSPQWIKYAIKASLNRLRVDCIDLYQIHYRDGITPLSTVVETLDELKEKGYIKSYGLSNIYRNSLNEIKDISNKFVSFQDEYSLACRQNEQDILELSESLHITPLTWGSLGQGILTGKYSENTTFDLSDRRSREAYVNFHGKKLIKNLDIVQALRQISNETDKSIPSIAIRFILDYLKKSVVLVGIKNPDQLLSNIQAMDWTLSEHQISYLLKISEENEYDK